MSNTPSMWRLVVQSLLLSPLLSSSCGTSSLDGVLRRVYHEQRFETLLLLAHSQRPSCLREESRYWTGSEVPVLRFNEQAQFYLSGSFNSEMLALLCLGQDDAADLELWRSLALNWQHMRHAQVLIPLEGEATPKRLQQVANTAEQHRLLHVVLLLLTGDGFGAYRLQPFAEERFLALPGNASTSIFTTTHNYRGIVASSLPDQVPPVSLVYEDRLGELRLSGIVGKLLLEFARQHNITLEWRSGMVLGEVLSFMLLRNLTLDGNLELGITLCGYEAPDEEGSFSYPCSIGKWFVVVPCAQPVGIAEVYARVCNKELISVVVFWYLLFALLDACFVWLLLRRRLSWYNVIFNERMISGLIGQSFKLHAHTMLSSRLAQTLLSLLGLVLSTLYGAHLNTLLTKLPTEHEISNFEQLRDSHVSVYFDENERFYFNSFDGARTVDAIRPKIRFLNTSYFQNTRRSLNMSQAFSMDSSEWLIMRKRQELFKVPAVCFHPALVFGDFLLLSIPLQANSIFFRTLNSFIHRVHMMGLIEFWRQQTMREMVVLGQISLNDPRDHITFREFKVGDLFWVWVCLVFGLLLGLLTFFCEILVGRLQKIDREPILET